jgi:nonsense-mediated mRNA decay protein 3
MDNKPSNYYQGILQLRNIDQKVLDFVEETCIKSPEGKVSKVEKVKNGFDFYMVSNKFLRALGLRLKDNFPGELNITAKLHTRDHQSSKNLYRLTVLFRQYNINKGEIIVIKGEEHKIIGIKDKIILKNLESNKKKVIGFNEIKRLKVMKKGELL